MHVLVDRNGTEDHYIIFFPSTFTVVCLFSTPLHHV
jgi:hypothetical protein